MVIIIVNIVTTFSEYTRHKEVVMHIDHDPAAEAMIDFAGKHLFM